MGKHELVSGYRVIDGKIVSDFTGKLIEDVPVLLLQICKEEKEVLREILSGKSLMLSEVLSLSLRELILLVDWRLSIVTQIRKAAKEYLFAEEHRDECKKSLLTESISTVEVAAELVVENSTEIDGMTVQQNESIDDDVTTELDSSELTVEETNGKVSEIICNAGTSEETLIVQEDCLSLGVQLESNQQPVREAETDNEDSVEKKHSVILRETNISSEEFLSINPKIPVLAPEYFVHDAGIVHTPTGEIIPDASIEVLNLSTRAYNGLMRGKLTKVSSLVGMPMEELLKIKNIGTLSQEEVCKKIEAYLDGKIRDDDPVKVNEIKSAPKNPEETIFPLELFSDADPDVPVIAPDYFVYAGSIVHKATGKIVPDVSIETLGLSARAYNCLMHAKLMTVANLVGMPFEAIRNIRNMGVLSCNEVQEKVEQYLDKACANSIQSFEPAGTTNAEEQDVKPIKIVVTEKSALHCFEKNDFEVLSVSDIKKRLPDVRDDELQEMLASLVSANELICKDDTYQIVHPSFWAQIEEGGTMQGDEPKDANARKKRILRLRAAGSTLEEIGNREGLTRERVRQIEKKAFASIVRDNTICFEEERYARLFQKYDLRKEFFFDYLGESKQAWYYLNTKYTGGTKNMEEALEDVSLSVEVRRAVEKFIRRGDIKIDGEYVRARRDEIEDLVLQRYCRETVTLENFFNLYNAFLQKYEITDESLQITDAVRAARSNRLSESTKLFWKQNRKLRYYDIEKGDYTELFETLNFEQYKNVEISTRKFLADFPELMQKYDLRDEYEIHNLLKKIHAENINPSLVFGRMPNLQFGTFDRDAAVREMLFALAPISQNDLAEELCREYGVRLDTIKANWFTCIAEYCHQGMYAVDYADMPEEHVALLKKNLTDDFYYLWELRKIYSNLVPNADLALLSPYNLKKLGFLVGTSYVLQRYATAEAYFNHLLMGKDIVNTKDINERYGQLTTYTTKLYSLKRELEIVEFEPYQYINIRRLEKLGYSRERIRKYGDRVWHYLNKESKERFFTIASLRDSGYEDNLDGLGFGELFYASILKADERFAYQRIGKSTVFSTGGETFFAQDFLVALIEELQSVDIYDFLDELKERYGIILKKSEVIEKIKNSEAYYDPIMQRLYANYEIYFEEI